MVSLVGGFPTCISFGEQTQKRVGWRAPAKIGHGLPVLFYGLVVGLRFFGGVGTRARVGPSSIFVSRSRDSHVSRIALVCHESWCIPMYPYLWNDVKCLCTSIRRDSRALRHLRGMSSCDNGCSKCWKINGGSWMPCNMRLVRTELGTDLDQWKDSASTERFRVARFTSHCEAMKRWYMDEIW